MKIQIMRLDGINTVATSKDYADIKGRGEIAHFLVELEIIKMELMGLWEKYTE